MREEVIGLTSEELAVVATALANDYEALMYEIQDEEKYNPHLYNDAFAINDLMGKIMEAVVDRQEIIFDQLSDLRGRWSDWD